MLRILLRLLIPTGTRTTVCRFYKFHISIRICYTKQWTLWSLHTTRPFSFTYYGASKQINNHKTSTQKQNQNDLLIKKKPRKDTMREASTREGTRRTGCLATSGGWNLHARLKHHFNKNYYKLIKLKLSTDMRYDLHNII